MTDVGRVLLTLIRRILEDRGTASLNQPFVVFERRETHRTLRTLVENVVMRAIAIADRNVAAAKKFGSHNLSQKRAAPPGGA